MVGFINTQFIFSGNPDVQKLKNSGNYFWPSRRGQFSLINRGIRKFWEDIILEQRGGSIVKIKFDSSHSVVLGWEIRYSFNLVIQTQRILFVDSDNRVTELDDVTWVVAKSDSVWITTKFIFTG